jgi:poly-gamma-glutamate synthesis protein (capsule biosynthesis protein)
MPEFLVMLGAMVLLPLVALVAFWSLPAWALAIVLALTALPLTALLAFWALRRHPMPTESDWTNPSFPWWSTYYTKKWFRPIVRTRRGSPLASYFACRSFEFDEPDLFDPKPIRLKAVGDVMACRHMIGPGGADLYSDIGATLFDGDLVTGNMEFAVNESWIIEELIRFSVPAHYTTPLLGDRRFGRYHYLSLANNHINDTFADGIEGACSLLDSLGIAHSGASRTPEEQDGFPILDVAGARIAMLSYTFSTNGVPVAEGRGFSVNLVRFNALEDSDYDPALIHRHIDLARERGAHYVIASIHMGLDHEVYPPERLVERIHALFERGIDLVIGHHPHIVGPVDRHRTADGRDCICFFSLGNLTATGLPFAVQRLSLIAGIDLVTGIDREGRHLVIPTGVELTPIYHSTRKLPARITNRIYPINEMASRIRAGDVPHHLGPRDVERISWLANWYSELLHQRGIRYR